MVASDGAQTTPRPSRVDGSTARADTRATPLINPTMLLPPHSYPHSRRSRTRTPAARRAATPSPKEPTILRCARSRVSPFGRHA